MYQPPPTEDEKAMLRQGFWEHLVEFGLAAAAFRVITMAIGLKRYFWY
jgi:hypothetical protein